MLFAICHYEVCWVEISYTFEKKTSALIPIIKYIFFSATNEETPSLVTNGFSGKSKFNKVLLLILLVFLSNRFKVESEINKNMINRNINLWKKKQQQLNFESEYKGHKIGENPNLGLPRVHEIVWNIWKLKKNFVCVWICKLRYLLILINRYSYFSVALFELFFW